MPCDGGVSGIPPRRKHCRKEESAAGVQVSCAVHPLHTQCSMMISDIMFHQSKSGCASKDTFIPHHHVLRTGNCALAQRSILRSCSLAA